MMLTRCLLDSCYICGSFLDLFVIRTFCSWEMHVILFSPVTLVASIVLIWNMMADII